jgi:hypothetical protein
MVAVAGHYFCDPGDQHRRVASSVLSSELNNHKLNETYRPTCAFSDLKQRPVHADMFQTWAVCYGYDPFLPVSQTGVVATPLSAALKIKRDGWLTTGTRTHVTPPAGRPLDYGKSNFCLLQPSLKLGTPQEIRTPTPTV